MRSAGATSGFALDDRVELVGSDPVLPTPFPIGEVAAVALAEVGSAASALRRAAGGSAISGRVRVAEAAAALVSFGIQRLDGKPTPRTNQSNPLVRLHRAADGRWIHLHGGFPDLAAGTRRVLGIGEDEPSFERVAGAVSERSSFELEGALAAAGQCGAVARTPEEWGAHPHGAVVGSLPTVRLTRVADAPASICARAASPRPLDGVRVVDLTRVLAGPTCGRTLAALGADVLNVRSARLPHVPAFALDTGHGKRSTFLELDDPDDLSALRDLVAGADVVVRGYRPGSLERRGLGVDDLIALRPGLVVATVSCYGPVGPWADRPGWEQLAQTASGIAVLQGSTERPALLPAAATDYTTGFVTAGGILRALGRRAEEGGSWHVEASLCQTAAWLLRAGAHLVVDTASGLGDLSTTTTGTADGELIHLGPVLELDGLDVRWLRPPPRLGEHRPEWLDVG